MDGNEEGESLDYYSMFVSLEQRVCLVVGGGAVGERKVRGLIRHGAVIRLVARDLTAWLRAQCDAGQLCLLAASYEERHLDGVDLVFAATDDSALNLKIASDARKRKVWSNLATDPGAGSFIVPAVFRKGPLKIAVSTSGLSPALAGRIREKLEKDFDLGWIFFIEFMGMLRTRIQAKGLRSTENQRIFREVSRVPIVECVRKKQNGQIVEQIHEICQPWLSLEEVNQIWDEIWKRFSSSSPHSVTSAEPSDI